MELKAISSPHSPRGASTTDAPPPSGATIPSKPDVSATDVINRREVLEEPSDSQILGVHDALQTPGATSQRLSFGMTPKSRRLPKPGEMLLSVHGSPLGVFKEDNMEAIHESEES